MVNAYAQSPLNQRPDSPSKPSPVLQPAHHPTVKIPSIGQEGLEYADYERLKAEAKQDDEEDQQQQQQQHPAPGQTRNVASDLKLHSPRPSAGNTTAKVSNMARSGLEASSRPSLSSRPSSMIYADSESGGSDKPVEPGTRVPMYPGAGEVQAPTPRSDSTKPRASGEFARPPDSYGLHSHDMEPTSKFEKEWYQKHPEAQERKEKISKAMRGPRPEDALSSDALNKLVRDTARNNEPRECCPFSLSVSSIKKKGGFEMANPCKPLIIGSEPGYMGTPDEEIGYRATDQLVSRLHLSRPSSRPASVRSPSRHSPEKGDHPDDIEGVAVHIDAPEASPNPDEPAENEPSTQEAVRSPGLGAQRQTTDSPVLAADEMDKEHYLPAAIPPLEWKAHSRANSANGRPKGFNRKTTSSSDVNGAASMKKSPTSAPQAPQSPPEVQEEDEKPLFSGEPEDEKARLERFKHRPDLAGHRFPSKDVWEDSPDEAQLETVVDAPEPVPEGNDEPSESNNPQASTPRPREEERKESTDGTESHLHADAAKELGGNKPGLERASSSYNSQHHFPSKDIWEDAPDSAHLEATIQEPDEKADDSPTSATMSPIDPPNKPSIPARPARPTKRPTRSSEDSKDTMTTAQSTQPSEPSPSETKKQPPVIPGRPKPQIPARPTRRPKSPVKQGSQDSGLSRSTSYNSATSTGSGNGNGTDTTTKGAPPAVPKSKPAIPARPVGSKIAALQAGFLSDLNNRLKIGPHAPPPKPQPKPEEKEVEEEKVPLSDARKGRAKGPVRRKPAAKPAVAAAAAAVAEEPKFEIVKAWDIFGISPAGVLTVNSQPKVEEPKVEEKPKDEVKPNEVEEPKEDEKPKEVKEVKEAEKPKEIEEPQEIEKPKEVEEPKEIEKPEENEKKQTEAEEEKKEEPAQVLQVPAETKPVEEMDSITAIKSVAATDAPKHEENEESEVPQQSDAAEPKVEPSEKPTDASAEHSLEEKEAQSLDQEIESSTANIEDAEQKEPVVGNEEPTHAEETPSQKPDTAAAVAAAIDAEKKLEHEQD